MERVQNQRPAEDLASMLLSSMEQEQVWTPSHEKDAQVDVKLGT